VAAATACSIIELCGMTDAAHRTPLPACYSKDYRPHDTLRIGREEEAIVWLWAKRSLFPWRRPVEWLFSPVTGDDPYIGDLWGVDDEGELLVIEGKRYKGGKRYNPFAKFLEYKVSLVPRTQELKTKWKLLWKNEVSDSSRTTERRVVRSGILPNSSKDVCPKRWCDLTLQAERYVRPETSEYQLRVEEFLDLRGKRGDPPPHFCGLLVAERQRGLAVPITIETSMRELATRVGSDHVHAFLASATLTADGDVALSVQRMRDPAPLPNADDFDAVVAFRARIATLAPDAVVAEYDVNFSHLRYNPVISELIHAFYEHKFVQSFDWVSWQHNAEQFFTHSQRLRSATIDDCIRLITTHVRQDKFSDGHFGEMVRNGHVAAILERLAEIKATMFA
jgi:hypothetical protein